MPSPGRSVPGHPNTIRSPPMTPRTGMPVGRPPALDRKLDDGTTVADVILNSLRRGNYIEEAAAQAGVNKTIAYDWLRVGARTRAALHKGQPRTDCTRKELLCAAFSEAVMVAQAEANATDVDDLERLARGIRRRVVTEKRVARRDPDGNVLLDDQGQPVMDVAERNVKLEDAEPNLAALTWRLERRDPSRYGRSTRVEVTGLDGAPVAIDMTVDEKRDRIAEHLERLAVRLAVNPDAELASHVLDVGSSEVSGNGSNGSNGSGSVH